MKKMFLLVATLCLSALAVSAEAADFSVTQSHEQFSENNLKIKSGDTINFKNADTVNYNIQIVNAKGDTDDKGLQKPGETVAETLTQPGEYTVRCGIHPGMKLKVTVE